MKEMYFRRSINIFFLFLKKDTKPCPTLNPRECDPLFQQLDWPDAVAEVRVSPGPAMAVHIDTSRLQAARHLEIEKSRIADPRSI